MCQLPIHTCLEIINFPRGIGAPFSVAIRFKVAIAFSWFPDNTSYLALSGSHYESKADHMHNDVKNTATNKLKTLLVSLQWEIWPQNRSLTNQKTPFVSNVKFLSRLWETAKQLFFAIKSELQNSVVSFPFSRNVEHFCRISTLSFLSGEGKASRADNKML